MNENEEEELAKAEEDAEVARLRAIRRHRWVPCIPLPDCSAPTLPVIPEGETRVDVWVVLADPSDNKKLLYPEVVYYTGRAYYPFSTMFREFVKFGPGGALAWTYRYVEPRPRMPGER